MTNKRIAVLTDPNEPYPPSDLVTLSYLKKLAAERNVDVEIVVDEDIHRLHTFDGLFIRCTMNINNSAFQWIQYAEYLGLNTVDSVKGTALGSDKLLQYILLQKNNIQIPKTTAIYPSSNLNDVLADNKFTFPLVMKIVNGCFSIGVSKVHDMAELKTKSSELFSQDHHCLILQEYTPTDFDWRIGVLNKKIIFACKYFMSSNQWQICKYNDDNTLADLGPGEPIDVANIPAPIISCVKQAATLLDNSFYGLDIKLINDKAYVIEMNDNPNLNFNMEDRIHRDDIYNRIIDQLTVTKTKKIIIPKVIEKVSSKKHLITKSS